MNEADQTNDVGQELGETSKATTAAEEFAASETTIKLSQDLGDTHTPPGVETIPGTEDEFVGDPPVEGEQVAAEGSNELEPIRTTQADYDKWLDGTYVETDLIAHAQEQPYNVVDVVAFHLGVSHQSASERIRRGDFTRREVRAWLTQFTEIAQRANDRAVEQQTVTGHG